jgi:hypothetical protein
LRRAGSKATLIEGSVYKAGTISRLVTSCCTGAIGIVTTVVGTVVAVVDGP